MGFALSYDLNLCSYNVSWYVSLSCQLLRSFVIIQNAKSLCTLKWRSKVIGCVHCTLRTKYCPCVSVTRCLNPWFQDFSKCTSQQKASYYWFWAVFPTWPSHSSSLLWILFIKDKGFRWASCQTQLQYFLANSVSVSVTEINMIRNVLQAHKCLLTLLLIFISLPVR